MRDRLLNDALKAMSDLHENVIPQENCEMDALLSAETLRKFVDEEARILYERNKMRLRG